MSGRDGLGVGDGAATWTGRGVLDADDLEHVRRRLADVLPGDDAVRLLATLDAERASHVRAVLLVPVLEKQRDDAQLQLEEETVRFQERIAASILAAGLTPFDASGNESGDPVDFTDDQVKEALARLNEQREVADGDKWRAIRLVRKALSTMRSGNCCDGEDATASDEGRLLQKELSDFLEPFTEPERGDPDWRNG